MNRTERQRAIYDWGWLCFGQEQMRSPPQRGIRLVEEAIELAQAVGCNKDKLHKLINYVYSRPVGVPAKELGGLSVCILALAECMGINAEAAEIAEFDRLMATPREIFTVRNAEKNAAGFEET